MGWKTGVLSASRPHAAGWARGGLLGAGTNLYWPNSFHLWSLLFELNHVANKQHRKCVLLLPSLSALYWRTSLARTPTSMGKHCGKEWEKLAWEPEGQNKWGKNEFLDIFTGFHFFSQRWQAPCGSCCSQVLSNTTFASWPLRSTACVPIRNGCQKIGSMGNCISKMAGVAIAWVLAKAWL